MAIKNIICSGIGFTPESVKFMPTHGFSIGAATTSGGMLLIQRRRRRISGAMVFIFGAVLNLFRFTSYKRIQNARS